MNEPYYGPDGTLFIWTGTGYHAIPRVAAADVGERSVNSYADENSSMGYGLTPTSSYTDGYQINDPAKYGLPTDAQVQFRPQSGGTADSFDYWLKSGDKEGSQISFQRDGDWYNPTFDGVQYWDTNDANKRVIPLSIMLGGGAAVAAGGAGMGAGLGLTNSMTGAGGTALAGSADAALWGGLGAAEGLGAAGTGLTLTGSAINPTTYSMTPSALAGDALLATDALTLTGSAINPLTYSMTPSALAGDALLTAGAGVGTAGIGDYASKIGEWILKNPQLAMGIAGTIGSALEGGGDDPAGGAGGGTGSGGWNGPIPQMQAVQARFDPPAGYRPGFSPEHVYIETAYKGGDPTQAVQLGAQPYTGPAMIDPEIDIPPPPHFADGGLVSPWARPSGIAAIPTRASPYPPFAGAAGGPAYAPPSSAGLQALFDRLNTPSTAPARLLGRDDGLGAVYARWAQAGFDPTRVNNAVASPGTRPVDSSQGTRAGFGGYKFADGGLIQGPGTGTSDSIPAVIDGDPNKPAKISTGEFIFPEWLVEELGNGSTEAGAQRLYAFMDRMKAKRDAESMTNPDALLQQLA